MQSPYQNGRLGALVARQNDNSSGHCHHFQPGCRMPHILKWGFVYFAILFSVGFLLGLVRVPLLEPVLGVRWAELAEMPLMLVAIILTAKFVVRKSRDVKQATLLGIGACGLAMLLAVEFTVVLTLRGITVAEYVNTRDPVAGSVYLIMLGLFMIMPWLIFIKHSIRSKNLKQARSG